jgi:hypothetical protein
MRPRRGAVIAALCATAVLSVCGARLAGFGLLAVKNTSRPPAEDPATSVSAEPFASAQVTAVRENAASNSDVAADPAPVEPAFVLAALPAAGVATVEDASPVAPLVQITTASKSHPVQTEKEGVSSIEIFDECLVPEICIDRYLWALYERAPKVDTAKVVEEVKETVEKNGKPKTITKKVIKYVDQDFTWKDPKAAERVRMTLQDYVIGGMDRNFKLKLYRALRALDDAGLSPGITSAFRDDYRQSIAGGLKASSNSSYHGGSLRGGYGHGLAADVVSVKGETRSERYRASEELWKWIDAHGAEFGIGRPYLDFDPAHIAPIDGNEYAVKRGRAKNAASETKRFRQVRSVVSTTTGASTAMPPKVRSIVTTMPGSTPVASKTVVIPTPVR